MFNITTLSFHDNKVLKCQLDMLIFVQVCRIVDTNLYSSIGSERTNESNEFFKGILCCKIKDYKSLKTIKS